MKTKRKKPSRAEQQKRWRERFTWKPGDVKIIHLAAHMKTKNRFTVVKIENAKWSVFDAHERTYVSEWPTRQGARNYAASQNTKEFLRTAPIIGTEPLRAYLARIAREDHRKRSSN
jgi:hypothetical protein